MTVLGAAKKIRHAVAVPIDGGRADIVAGDVLVGEFAHILHDPFVSAAFCLAEKIRVLRIDQQIEPTVAIPIDCTKFATTTAASAFGVELQGMALLIDEGAACDSYRSSR